MDKVLLLACAANCIAGTSLVITHLEGRERSYGIMRDCVHNLEFSFVGSRKKLSLVPRGLDL